MPDEIKLSEPLKLPVHIPVTVDQTKGVTVGGKIKIQLEGNVVGVHKDLDGKNAGIDVELGNTKIDTNFADQAVKEMAGVKVMNEADRAFEEFKG